MKKSMYYSGTHEENLELDSVFQWTKFLLFVLSSTNLSAKQFHLEIFQQVRVTFLVKLSDEVLEAFVIQSFPAICAAKSRKLLLRNFILGSIQK